jgi:hypothetical protein
MDCAAVHPTWQRPAGVPLQPTAFTALGQLFFALVDEETGEIIGRTNQKTLIMRKDGDSGGQVVEMRCCGISYLARATLFQLVRGGVLRRGR